MPSYVVSRKRLAIRSAAELSDEQRRLILADYRSRPNIRIVANQHRVPVGVVTELVDERWGADRWKAGSELKVRHQMAKPKVAENDMGPRVPLESLDRATPDALCQRYLGHRFEQRHGASFLDGRITQISERMREVNRERLKRGEKQLPVPEWRV